MIWEKHPVIAHRLGLPEVDAFERPVSTVTANTTDNAGWQETQKRLEELCRRGIKVKRVIELFVVFDPALAAQHAN